MDGSGTGSGASSGGVLPKSEGCQFGSHGLRLDGGSAAVLGSDKCKLASCKLLSGEKPPGLATCVAWRLGSSKFELSLGEGEISGFDSKPAVWRSVGAAACNARFAMAAMIGGKG